MLLNCGGVGEDSWESLGLQGDQISQSVKSVKRKSVLNIHWKDWCWSWNSNTLATWCEELTHFKRPWSWERLRAEGEVDDRGWDGWIASLTQWTWVSKLREMVKDREVWCDAVSRVAKSQTWLNDSATTTSTQVMLLHKYILELPSEWQGTIAEMLNMVELEDSLNPD